MRGCRVEANLWSAFMGCWRSRLVVIGVSVKNERKLAILDCSQTSSYLCHVSGVEKSSTGILIEVVQGIDSVNIIRCLGSDSVALVHWVIYLAITVSTLLVRCITRLLRIMGMMSV